MLSVVVDMLVRGSYVAWGVAGGVWLFGAAIVLAHRRSAQPSGLRVVTLLALTSLTATLGLAVASAVAVPRMRWITMLDADEYIEPAGATWRRLRGPSVPVSVGGDPDLAIPVIDAEGQWVLFGLLAGRPVPGLAPAADLPPKAGAPRICATEGEACRAWPSAWPDPTQAPRSGDLAWSKEGALSALAFDAESGLYLQSAGALAGADRMIELLGRITNDPPRENVSSLFVLRRIAGGPGPDASAPGGPALSFGGRMQALRVVSKPVSGSYVFRLQRADVSLVAGPLALRLVARPLLLAAALGLPLALFAYLLSSTWLSAWLRRKGAVLRKGERPLTLTPIPSNSAPPDAAVQCTATEDAKLGDAEIPRGTVLAVAFAGHDGRLITSSAWLEIPSASSPAAQAGGAPPESESAIDLGDRRAARPFGLLVPADRLLFRSAARTWLTHRLRPLAICAAGVAIAAPGVVAVASLLGAR